MNLMNDQFNLKMFKVFHFAMIMGEDKTKANRGMGFRSVEEFEATLARIRGD